MMKPFTYDGETCEINDKTALVQTLERCVAAYRDRCLNSLYGDHPDPMWVRLYVASERLRLAVCKNDVARAILEIGADLLGCNDMAILELHGDSTLSLLAGSGMTGTRRQALAANARAIAEAIEAFNISIANSETAYDQLWSQLEITAFIPLWYENRPRGAIIFYRLLPQRKDLDLADRELLRLLSMFCGPSLFNASAELRPVSG